MIVQNLLYYLMEIVVWAFKVLSVVFVTLDKTLMTTLNYPPQDYIIVGGGTAGAILAGRLSENPNVRVLLIEAGGEALTSYDIPALGPLKQMTDLDWQYKTVPQIDACLGLNDNVSRWPTGKILGGSSALNYMVHLKGHKLDYLEWKEPNSSNWDYEDINYYLKKASITPGNPGGTVEISNSAMTSELSEAILKSAVELNYGIGNMSGPELITGFMKPQVNIRKSGVRYSLGDYIARVQRTRKNLHIIRHTVVEEILFKDGFEAYGVRTRMGQEIRFFYAKQEVIVCAGTVGSAKLLMLSGIGPSDALADGKIKQKIDLPTGRNLQDHLTTGLDLIILEKAYSFFDWFNPINYFEDIISRYFPFSKGFVELIGVTHSKLVKPKKDSPDLQFMVLPAGMSTDNGVLLRKLVGLKDEIWESYFSPLREKKVASILPVLLHPKSRGNITLNPKNPLGEPLINPGYLSHKDDVKTLIEGIRIIEEIVGTKPMVDIGARFNTKVFPGCSWSQFDSDKYWECYIRHLTLTSYHPVGTCKMGSLKDGGVVDYRLRVYKTNKLRVVDASIMPTLPSANTNAAVVAIAEKAADLIKEDYYHRFSKCDLKDVFYLHHVDTPKGSLRPSPVAEIEGTCSLLSRIFGTGDEVTCDIVKTEKKTASGFVGKGKKIKKSRKS